MGMFDTIYFDKAYTLPKMPEEDIFHADKGV